MHSVEEQIEELRGELSRSVGYLEAKVQEVHVELAKARQRIRDLEEWKRQREEADAPLPL